MDGDQHLAGLHLLILEPGGAVRAFLRRALAHQGCTADYIADAYEVIPTLEGALSVDAPVDLLVFGPGCPLDDVDQVIEEVRENWVLSGTLFLVIRPEDAPPMPQPIFLTDKMVMRGLPDDEAALRLVMALAAGRRYAIGPANDNGDVLNV